MDKRIRHGQDQPFRPGGVAGGMNNNNTNAQERPMYGPTLITISSLDDHRKCTNLIK